jgi:hypothetical protein
MPGCPRNTAVSLALVAACSSDPVADPFGDGEAGGDTTTAGSETSSTGAPSSEGAVDDGSTGGGSSSGASSEDGGPKLDVGNDDPPSGCASAAEQYIFLLESPSGALHRYDAEANTVAPLGTPMCPGADAPMALTIDRAGTLWALMVDAEGMRRIYTIAADTLDCMETGFVDPWPDYTVAGGLAFVADAPGSSDESIYISLIVGGLDPATPLTLGKIDEGTMDLAIEGDLPIVGNGYYQIADLVGTGDARLFGFFPGDQAVITEIDEQAVDVAIEQPLDFGVGSPWAFTQWEGRLWLFSPAETSGSSEVRAYDLAAQQVEVIEPDLGVLVVGAAVSTCAPYEPEG